MCGINGACSYRGDPGVNADAVIAVRNRMSARGPDGAGAWISAGRRAAFGHCRLAIIDLSERGAQPMCSIDGSLTITYNGEIYNYRELKSALVAAGHSFVSDSDTEVLLALYKQ